MMEFAKEDKRALFDGRNVSAQLPYESLESNVRLIQEGQGRLSISGAQEKYALVEENGTLLLSKEGEQGKYILKPQSQDRRFFFKEDMPANEYLTMHIAWSVYHIPTAANGLCWFKNGEIAYLCRRFDIRPDGTKYKMEDLSSVAGLTKERYGEDFKYTALSYEDCAGLITKYCISAKAELLKFFRQIVFNYLFLNADAHAKNFSLMEYAPGDYRLSPAYDLLNTQLHLSTSIFALEKGLFKEGTPILDTTPIGRPMFLEFGNRLELPEKQIVKELDFFAEDHPQVLEMIENSLLSPDAKKYYRMDYIYRRSTLK